MGNQGWYGFDLDGTLARYEGWQGEEHIGEPIPKMIAKVKEHLAKGDDVRIFTARVCDPTRVNVSNAIMYWCKVNIGVILPITCVKDYHMILLYDDRCKQVIPNTGVLLEDTIKKKKVIKCSCLKPRNKTRGYELG